MGRHRQYPTDAERQRAFRRRQATQTVRVERAALDRLRSLLDELQTAVAAAAAAGDPLARAGAAAGHETLLERLAAAFAARAHAPGGESEPP